MSKLLFLKTKLVSSIILIAIVIGMISGFYMYNKHQIETESTNKKYKLEQMSPLTHHFESIIKYKNKYMGNSNNILNLNNNLPLADFSDNRYENKLDRFEFIHYFSKNIEDNEEEKVKISLVYNATANFVLINNMQLVTFKFPNKSFTFSRKKIEKWYGCILESLQNYVSWTKEVQSKLADKVYIDSFVSENSVNDD